jgi:hypothetical protein
MEDLNVTFGGPASVKYLAKRLDLQTREMRQN